MVTIRATYEGKLRCTSTHDESGSTLATDAPKDNEGLGASFSPTDLVATAHANCAMTIMGIVARREGIDLAGMTATVVKRMAPDPRRIIAAPIEIHVPGRLSTDQKKLLENAARNCPVSKSLHPDIDGSMTFVYPDE